MKVLHFSSFGSVCGVADYTDDMVAALAPHTDFEHHKFGFPRHEVEFKYNERQLRTLFQRCAQQSVGYDITHVQHEFGFFVGKYPFHRSIELFGDFLRQIKSERVLITFHTGPFFPQQVTWRNFFEPFSVNTRAWHRAVSQLLQPGSRYHALVHNDFAREMMVLAGAHPDSITVMAHPMKILEKVPPDTQMLQDIRQGLSLTPQSFVLSTLGFILPGKGILSCIETLHHLPPQYKLVIGGGKPVQISDSYLKEIKRTIAAEKFEDRVFITGYMNPAQVQSLFQVADLFLFLYTPISYSSGAITMALQSGKPIITTNIKTFYDIQKEAQCFQMTYERPAQETAKRILALHNDPERVAQLVANQKKYCTQNTWPMAGDFINRLYLRLISPVLSPA